MSKSALYSKYRPTQLSEIVGQDQFRATLLQSSANNRFSHSYLLCGEKGSGKTSSARIIANLINCENVRDGKVCMNCRSCKVIQNGSTMDIVELDGATQRKVEDINVLIENASWSPQELKKKVFIIDESHQLSSTAISSLLKITEEPPEYLIFIFCTTEFDKTPETILTRCQKYMFGKIKSGDICNRLKFISQKEGIKITDESLFILSQLGRGSMRDAIGYLDQISMAANEKEITEEFVNKYFCVVDRKGIYDIIESMIAGDYSMILEKCNDMIVASVDVRNVLYEISEVFRNIMVIKIQGEKTKLVDLPDHEVKRIFKFSQSMGLGQLDKLSKEFSTIEKELTYSINKRLIMESTLIRCTARINSK